MLWQKLKNAKKVTVAPRIIVFALGLAAAGLTACGKKAEANVSVAVTNQETAQGTQTQNGAVTQSIQPTPDTATATVSDPVELNRELRKWILRNRRPPKNFEDFSSTAGVQIAPPPDGKKYAIDKTMHVILVKR
jgi:hypothetical protein